MYRVELRKGSFAVLLVVTVLLMECGSAGQEKASEVKSAKKEVTESQSRVSGSASSDRDIQGYEFEGIDISKIDLKSNNVHVGGVVVDLDASAEDMTLDRLKSGSEVVFRGSLLKLDSWLDENTMMHTDYTFLVKTANSEEVPKEVVVRMMGGIMDFDTYMKEKGIDESGQEKQYDYVVVGSNGFEPLSPDTEYIIFCNYVEKDDVYMPKGFYLGVLKEDKGKDEFVRYTGKDSGWQRMDTSSLDLNTMN